MTEKEKFNRFVMEDVSDPFDFYYSENWFFVKEVYVPRKIVLDIIAVNKSLFSPFTVIGIITENGEAVFWHRLKKKRQFADKTPDKMEFINYCRL